MTTLMIQSSWQPKRSNSVGKQNYVVRSFHSDNQDISFKQLKRRSSKVELNKNYIKTRFYQKKKSFLSKSFLSNQKSHQNIGLNEMEDSYIRKKFILSVNPLLPSSNAMFFKPDFETKESMFNLLEKGEKLDGYLKPFRKPNKCPTVSSLWTEKVSNIQKTINGSVYNAGIIAKIVFKKK